MVKAIILLSGGIDSTVLLAMALRNRRQCFALTLDYAQRHRAELRAAKAITRHFDVPHRIIRIDPLTFDQSSLVGSLPIPRDRTSDEILHDSVCNTYVPARNTLFLAYAMAQAELFEAQEIYMGANAMDVAFPDCSLAYISSFQRVLNLATRQAVAGKAPRLVAPLLDSDKRAVIAQGVEVGAPLHLTMSCYDPTNDHRHCGRCDACVLRREGFTGASQPDPTNYRKS